MPRSRSNRSAKEVRHDPLATQLRKDEILVDDEEAARMGGGGGETKLARKRRKRRVLKKRTTEETETYVDAKMTAKIMAQAEAQREEEQALAEIEGRAEVGASSSNGFGSVGVGGAGGVAFTYESDGEESVFSEDEDNYLEGAQLSAADERLLSKFTAASSASRPAGTRNLADLIEAKLREKEGVIILGGSAVDVGERLGATLPKKVVKAYHIVGRVLRDYRSGRLPKAFKVIPAMENWEELVFITNPPEWSAHAMYAAVKVFASNLNAKMAQRFFNLVLLPCIREDIAENRKLAFHRFQALKKALYKPAAFYKGIVLPLLEEGCSVREAMIVSSVIRKSKVPMLHSAAALLRMVELPFSGPTTIMIDVLIDKKYALPLRVIDALVQFFVSFRDVELEMPLVWHRALRTFAERYHNDLQDFQLELLRQLLHVQQHHHLTDEIRRILFNPRKGTAPLPSASAGAGMSIYRPDPVSMPQAPVFDTPLTRGTMDTE